MAARADPATRSVALVQRRLTHYRVPFAEALRARLAERAIELRLLHGEPTAEERSKNDSGRLDWAEALPTTYFAGGRICWQPFAARVRDCELVIVSHENKLVNNFGLLLGPRRSTALALFGHGRNMQSRAPGGWAERFKRWTARRPDWWFAYTELSAGFVRDAGFPGERVTVVENSIDTAALRRDVEQARAVPRAELLARLGFGAGPLGLFVGSLYEDKRLGLLLEAAERIHDAEPAFMLALAGDGPERARVQAAAASRPFVRWLGPVHGRAKADLLAAASVMLNPGLVGLGILDAFVAGLPLLTTDCRIHSPEIAYLEPGVNGLITEETSAAFAGAALGLLRDPARASALAEGAARAGQRYSVENMAARFADGIAACLAWRRSRVS